MADLTTCTMTGRIVDDQGIPLSGAYQIIPSVDRMVATESDLVISLTPQSFILDEHGGFSVTLASSASADSTPLDVVWTLLLPATDSNNTSTISFAVPVGVSEAQISEHVLTTGNARSLYYRGGLWSRI